VFVDWGQNDRHKSTVAPYSLRAKLARPTVSLPLDWDELAAATDEQALLPSPAEALERVAEHGDLFAPVLGLSQHLVTP
jgi:bifunctional non-homologous end joining protein LigD